MTIKWKPESPHQNPDKAPRADVRRPRTKSARKKHDQKSPAKFTSPPGSSGGLIKPARTAAPKRRKTTSKATSIHVHMTAYGAYSSWQIRNESRFLAM